MKYYSKGQKDLHYQKVIEAPRLAKQYIDYIQARLELNLEIE